MQQNNDNWMPLESNPEVINPFIAKMGLKTENYCFQEMLGLEDWAMEMIPQPVLGVMFLYQCTPVQVAFKNTQADQLDPTAVPNEIFYMKQFAQNACGTIALFHIILNSMPNHADMVTPNSYLTKFLSEAQTQAPEDRGKTFEKNEEIKTEHKGASQQGQTAAQSDADSHFIAFIPHNGRLWELDGMKKCPVNMGPCSQEEFLAKACEEVKKYMQRDPDNLNFSTIVLAKTPQWLMCLNSISCLFGNKESHDWRIYFLQGPVL